MLLSTDHVAIGRWPRSTLLADVLLLTRHYAALEERLKVVKVRPPVTSANYDPFIHALLPSWLTKRDEVGTVMGGGMRGGRDR